MSHTAMQNLYSGGADKLYANMPNGKTLVLHEYLGPMQMRKHELVVGDVCKETLLRINLTWNQFLKHYWPDQTAKFDSDNESVFLEALKPLGFKFESIEQATEVLLDLLKIAKEPQFLTAISRNMKLHKSLSQVCERMFFNWRSLLESYVETLADSASEANPEAESKDSVLSKWKELNDKYGINSSSLILTALAPPKAPSKLPWAVKINEWAESQPIPKLQIDKTHRDKLETSEWFYQGFCSLRSIQRFITLLACPVLFPIELKLQKHVAKILLIKPYLVVNPLLKTTISKPESNSDKYVNLFNIVECYLQILGVLKSTLIEREKYFVECAFKLAKVNNILHQAQC